MLMFYEALVISSHLNVMEVDMPYRIKGLYGDNTIWINKYITTHAEKRCVLAEELGHYYTSAGDILDLANIRNIKQEQRARFWAYDFLIPLYLFVDAHKAGIRNKFELAEHLSVTEEFLEMALKRYKEKFGVCVQIDDCYHLMFDPLGIIELF